MYGTDNPMQDQITAATSVLANTAQNLVDNNLGYNVPYLFYTRCNQNMLLPALIYLSVMGSICFMRLTMPTAKCATAECAAGILPNRPLSQAEIDAMRNGAADFAGNVSTQARPVSRNL